MNILLLFYLSKNNSSNSIDKLHKLHNSCKNFRNSLKKIFKPDYDHINDNESQKELYRLISPNDTYNERVQSFNYRQNRDKKLDLDFAQKRIRKQSGDSVKSEIVINPNKQKYSFERSQSYDNFNSKNVSVDNNTKLKKLDNLMDLHVDVSNEEEKFRNNYETLVNIDNSFIKKEKFTDNIEKIQKTLDLKIEENEIYENLKDFKNTKINTLKSSNHTDFLIKNHADVYKTDQVNTKHDYLYMRPRYDIIIISKLKDINNYLNNKNGICNINIDGFKQNENLANLVNKFKIILEKVLKDYEIHKYTKIDLLYLFESGIFIKNIIEEIVNNNDKISNKICNKLNNLDFIYKIEDEPIYVEMTAPKEI